MTAFPDFKVKIADNESFAENKEIKVQEVTAFPDVKLQKVTAFQDFEIFYK